MKTLVHEYNMAVVASPQARGVPSESSFLFPRPFTSVVTTWIQCRGWMLDYLTPGYHSVR